MRHPWSVPVLLAFALLVGSAVGSQPAQAQAEAFPFRVGERVTFSFQGGGSRTCRVEEIKGVFARCGDPSAPSVVRYGDPVPQQWWVNVAEVEWVTPIERR